MYSNNNNNSLIIIITYLAAGLSLSFKQTHQSNLNGICIAALSEGILGHCVLLSALDDPPPAPVDQ